jgi:hypothetical protein
MKYTEWPAADSSRPTAMDLQRPDACPRFLLSSAFLASALGIVTECRECRFSRTPGTTEVASARLDSRGARGPAFGPPGRRPRRRPQPAGRPAPAGGRAAPAARPDQTTTVRGIRPGHALPQGRQPGHLPGHHHPATPAALAAIIAAAGIDDLAAYLHGHASTGDLSRRPGAAKHHDHESRAGGWAGESSDHGATGGPAGGQRRCGGAAGRGCGCTANGPRGPAWPARSRPAGTAWPAPSPRGGSRSAPVARARRRTR